MEMSESKDDFKDMLIHAEKSLRRDVWPENREEDRLWASYITSTDNSKRRFKKKEK